MIRVTPDSLTCDWHPEHGKDDRPRGKRCGAPATHRIVWLDGSKRYSLACRAHLELERVAPKRRIHAITTRKEGK